MSSRAKTLIDSLRKTAIGLGITSTLSKDRDLCARLLFGRPYASVLPAEQAGSLRPPAVSTPHAASLVEKHGARAQQLLQAAALLVRQEAGDSAGLNSIERDSKVAQHPHFEAHAMELQQVLIHVDHVACKDSGFPSETLFERIRARGLAAGYAVRSHFVGKGGDKTNPIAMIHANGPTQDETVRVIDDVQGIAHEELFDLLTEANAGGKEQEDERRLIKRAFQRKAIHHWRMIDARTFAFNLKEIRTAIRLTLKQSRSHRGGFDFRLSHLIHTPMQAGPYSPSNPWGDDLAYALSQAVTSVTMYYDEAVERGFPPNPDWLVPNRI